MSSACTSYDNDKLCVLNVCPGTEGQNYSIKTITTIDSPYSTLVDDYIILVDASAGNVTVNLSNYPILPNQAYEIKRIDGSANIVSIIPPIGETVDNTTVYNLRRINEVVVLTHDNTNSNYEVTNDKPDRILTTCGDLFVHNGTTLVRLPVGLNNQVLTVDTLAATCVSWKTPAVSPMYASYTLKSDIVNANKTTYVAASYFPWDQSRHGAFPNGTVIFNVVIGNRDLSIDMYNTATSLTIGQLLNINVSGTYTFSITNPIADAALAVRVKCSSQGGVQPLIYGIILEFST